MRQSAIDKSSELAPAELAALTGLLRSAGLTGAHLEIGTAAGGTLKELLLCYAPPRPRFVAIDPFTYFPDQKAIVTENLREAGIDPAEVELRENESEPALAAARKAGERYDFIFIDANHDARHVMRDLRWASLLSPGGFLCLHDYAPRFPGVIWATDRFLLNNGNYRRASLTDSLLTIRKLTDGRNDEVPPLDVWIAELVTQQHRLMRSVRKRIGGVSA